MNRSYSASGRAGRGIQDELKSALQGVAAASAAPRSVKAAQVAGWGHQTSPTFGYRRERTENRDLAQWTVEADECARSSGYDVDQPSLQRQGLDVAVSDLARQIEARYGVTVRVEDDGRPKHADAEVRDALYHSLLELFVDAVKHARARRICVRLERDERTLDVTFEDDGISMRSVAASAGFGLSTIRERLSHAGGNLRIESVPEHGTKICLRAPLTTDRTLNTKALL